MAPVSFHFDVPALRQLPATSVHHSVVAWVLQEQARQDGGGDWRSHARRAWRPRPELVLYIDTAEGLQQVTARKLTPARGNAAKCLPQKGLRGVQQAGGMQ